MGFSVRFDMRAHRRLVLPFLFLPVWLLAGCATISQSQIGQERLSILLPKAEAANAEAQYLLGDFYSSGYDWPREHEKALFWFSKAAEQGHEKAHLRVAFIYERGFGPIEVDKEKALSWYRKSAAMGNPQAITFLGRAYHRSIGVEKDAEKARQYYLQAAELGHGPAQYWSGKFLESAKGGPRDLVAARAWYLLAIDHIVDGSLKTHAAKRARAIELKLSTEENESVQSLLVSYYEQLHVNNKDQTS